MTIRAGLHHVTRYRYDRPVGLGPHMVRLRPAPHCRTRVPSYSIKVTPEQHFVNWQQDAHGNWIARYVFPEKATEFTVTVDFLADLEVFNPFDFFVEPYAEKFPFSYDAELRDDLAPYLALEPAGPRLAAYLATISREPRNTIDFLVELNQRLRTEVRYLIRLEEGVQTAEDDADRKIGIVPRLRVAARAGAAPARAGGAIRLRLPDSDQAGPDVDRRSRGRHA